MEGTKCFQIITGNYLLNKTNLITLLRFFLTATCLKINDYYCLTDRWWIPNIEWCNKSSWLVCRPRLMESGTCSTPERYSWCKDSCCWFTSNGTSSWSDSNARRYNKGNAALLLRFCLPPKWNNSNCIITERYYPKSNPHYRYLQQKQ